MIGRDKRIIEAHEKIREAIVLLNDVYWDCKVTIKDVDDVVRYAKILNNTDFLTMVMEDDR